MEPFRIPNQLANVTDIYPDSEVILEAVQQGGESARIALTQLWLSEGIPFAFRECPAVYESIRLWLSSHIGVHAKVIGLIGSARLGSSLAPNKFGKSFNYNSDLDLFIVSHVLFDTLKKEFRKWSIDFESEKVQPNNKREAKFWSDNNARGPRLLERGFIDQNMIPNIPRYSKTSEISQIMWLLVEKLKITQNSPSPLKASIRCYNSWSSFVRQNLLNLTVL